MESRPHHPPSGFSVYLGLGGTGRPFPGLGPLRAGHGFPDLLYMYIVYKYYK